MPRISAPSVGQHREQVHRRVFEAFSTLLAGHSVDAITMAQLAAAAGIGRTAIYHHFADKEAVVVAFASYETGRYIQDLEAALADIDDPSQRLALYIRHHLDAGQQFHIGSGGHFYGTLSPTAMLAIREHVVVVEDVLRSILSDGVAAGTFIVDDDVTAISLIHACLAPRHLPAPAVERFILRALGAQR
ncbi:TetR/AcrR family transcriptional regulator [Mycolicibacterium sp. CH28]|uniref:TetR/AcrR family transcriptional regulator n=1 Tax=Mycolicibacterium sp. CH28 TaxID=2512237 RepID=UPI00107FD60D|nr:TetR/AcrR family transcriptional regulator [Mycolicibacterium sp. CH28]TGD90558.1 TetR/AcrR family transcriptional regulator [Mycolicibacterium sp. CH28]